MDENKKHMNIQYIKAIVELEGPLNGLHDCVLKKQSLVNVYKCSIAVDVHVHVYIQKWFHFHNNFASENLREFAKTAFRGEIIHRLPIGNEDWEEVLCTFRTKKFANKLLPQA